VKRPIAHRSMNEVAGPPDGADRRSGQVEGRTRSRATSPHGPRSAAARAAVTRGPTILRANGLTDGHQNMPRTIGPRYYREVLIEQARDSLGGAFGPPPGPLGLLIARSAEQKISPEARPD